MTLRQRLENLPVGQKLLAALLVCVQLEESCCCALVHTHRRDNAAD